MAKRLLSTRWPGLAALALALAATPALGEDVPVHELRTAAAQSGFVAGEILVKFAYGVDAVAAEQRIADHGCTVVEQSSLSGFCRVAISEGASEVDMALAFAAEEGCEWASPNFLAYPTHQAIAIPPNDPDYGLQTHLELINVEDAWAREIGDQDVVVAVIDNGVAFEDRVIPAHELGGVVPGATHYRVAPDLAQTHFVPGYDFIHDDPNPNGDNLHGTAVTATLTQDTDNGLGTAGVAPGVSIMPIKVLTAAGGGSLAGLIDGINFATQNGANLVNLSLAFSSIASNPVFDFFFVGLDAAIEAAHDAGVILVGGTGNDQGGVVSRPALHPDVIAVGASNFDGLTRTYYSQYSTGEAALGIPATPGLPGSVEIVAPVGDLVQDLDGNGVVDAVYQETMLSHDPEHFAITALAGTSISTPQVTAVAALLVSAGKQPGQDGLGVDVVRQILRDTAKDLGAAGTDLEFGAGQLDAGAALAADEVTICHVPPGDPASAETQSVGIPAARAHVGHGDTLGPCP